jgi:hypothetical protein
MSIWVNPIIYDPTSPSQFVVCACIWATFLALICALWILIEDTLLTPPQKKRTEQRSWFFRFSCTYLTIFILSLAAYGIATQIWPQFGAAANHFFSLAMEK